MRTVWFSGLALTNTKLDDINVKSYHCLLIFLWKSRFYIPQIVNVLHGEVDTLSGAE